VLCLDRLIYTAAVGFDSGSGTRDSERVGDRLGRLLHGCALVGDGVLQGAQVTLSKTPHSTGMRVDEAAKCPIEQFLAN